MYISISVFILIILLSYFDYIKVKNSDDIEKNKFDGEFFNTIYLLSYSFPLKYFLKEKEILNRGERKIREEITKSNLTSKFNLRSFMAMRFLLLFFSFSLFMFVMLVKKEIKGSSFNTLGDFIYLIITLLISLIPNFVLRFKESKYKKFYYDEVVILQLFMILLIKSNSTVENILFAFSKMDTFYKNFFEKAYRISLRNKYEALSYLENKFEDIIFGNSFSVLKDMFEYSKDDSVRILEANLKRIEEDSINKKRKEELNKFSFSQVSMMVPLLVVVFLGAIPIVHYGMSITINTMQGL